MAQKITRKNTSKKLEKAVALLKLVSHPVRLRILCVLIEHTELSVGDIIAAINAHMGTPANQSQISQFLAKMRAEKLVSCRKHGQMVFYQIKSPQAQKLVTALHDIYCG